MYTRCMKEPMLMEALVQLCAHLNLIEAMIQTATLVSMTPTFAIWVA